MQPSVSRWAAGWPVGCPWVARWACWGRCPSPAEQMLPVGGSRSCRGSAPLGRRPGLPMLGAGEEGVGSAGPGEGSHPGQSAGSPETLRSLSLDPAGHWPEPQAPAAEHRLGGSDRPPQCMALLSPGFCLHAAECKCHSLHFKICNQAGESRDRPLLVGSVGDRGCRRPLWRGCWDTWATFPPSAALPSCPQVPSSALDLGWTSDPRPRLPLLSRPGSAVPTAPPWPHLASCWQVRHDALCVPTWPPLALHLSILAGNWWLSPCPPLCELPGLCVADGHGGLGQDTAHTSLLEQERERAGAVTFLLSLGTQVASPVAGVLM